MENKKNDINVNSDNGTSIVLDDKIDNNIFNNTLINIKNIVQKIIDENKKSMNLDGNDKLLKTNKNNIIKGTENNNNKNNNNFYSNVHIKTITNINEVISNNINSNTDNNVNKSNDKINKSNDSINLYENINKNDKVQKNILYNQFVQNNNNKNKKKKIFISNKINRDFNLILTDRRKKNKTFISNKKSDKREKKIKDKDNSFISNTTEIKEEKDKSFLITPVKKGPSARISIKDYIKKTKSNLNQNILNSNKKRVITNENDNSKNNNVTMDEIKRNLTKENSKKINKVHFHKKVANKDSNNEKIIIDLETPRTPSKGMRHSMPENYIKNLRNIANNLNLGQNSLNSNTSQGKRKYKSISRKSTNKKLLNTLSERERSFFILAKSPILRLSERLFFGRSTPGIREILTVPDLLNINEKYLNNKKKELEQKIQECNRKIGSPFTASKTAEILFNLILEKDEDEFKQLFQYSESDKNYYYAYIKIIYLLSDFEYEKIESKQLNSRLYALMLKKGFNSIKDYLIHIYIKKKENINIVYKIDKINEVLRAAPDLIKNKSRYRFCRFILFTSFLIGEIVKYGNDIKNTVSLNLKTKNFIDIINKKIESYRKNKLLISLKSNKS